MPDSKRGIRFDELLLNISWPLPVTMISEQDANWPNYEPTKPSTSAAKIRDLSAVILELSNDHSR